MAIEVMSQACRSAGRDPDGIATVFATAMGDMQITDYMCSALAQTPKLISPTRFHNSVHNAAPGYWSIATGSHSAANAVSAFDTTYSMAFLEGAIQAVEENTPVLVVTQEVAALDTLRDIWPTRYPFSAAFLLAPASGDGPRLCRAEFTVVREKVDWPPMPASLADAYASDFTANLLPLLADIASLQSNGGSIRTTFPISPATAMHLTLNAASRDLG
jgi:hypothetical protein